MKTPRRNALVKYEIDGYTGHDPFKGMLFFFLGEIPNQPGHSLLIDRKGKTYVLHTENIKEIPND